MHIKARFVRAKFKRKPRLIKGIRWCTCLLFGLSLFSGKSVAAPFEFFPSKDNDSIIQKAPAIIPLPAMYKLLPFAAEPSASFKLTAGTPIILGEGVAPIVDLGLRGQWQSFLRSGMFIASGEEFKFPFITNPSSSPKIKTSGILLQLESNLAGKKSEIGSVAVTDARQIRGSYTLQINPNQVIITAEDHQGLFYGLTSLLQLAVHEQQSIGSGTSINIPCWQIKDQPQYAWRGVMLDESRHFFGMQQVKKLLDWMAYYKLNYFHWHLTDEPAWRMQVKAYPKLTTIGAIGNKTDSLAPARFYTQKEIAEVVNYAKDRGITTIPEIDMPGHATAANRAYPENSGGGTGKFADFTFNPGRDSTYRFLTTILKETSGLFGSNMVHLGGDEVSFGSSSWDKLPQVQDLKRKKHLKDNKAVEAYFLRRMADSALKFNKKVLTWDEGVDAGLDPASTIIFWWRHDKREALERAMTGGYDIVLCPRIPLYFDFVQDSTHKIGRKWSGKYASLKQVFDFKPATYTRGMEKNGHVLGMQANLWTETVQTVRRMDFMLFPRLAALASAAWSKPGHRKYNQFIQTLKKEFLFYKKANIYYFNPFNPDSTPEPVK